MQIAIRADRNEFTRLGEPVQRFTQIVAGSSLDASGVFDNAVKRTVLGEPFGRSFWADLADARNIVGGIADEGQVINDFFRRYAKLFRDAFRVQNFIVHGIDQRDTVFYQLRQILVTRRYDNVESLSGTDGNQRTDYIIGLDSRDGDNRPAEHADQIVDGSGLPRKIVGHCRTVGLVFLIEVMAECFAFCIFGHYEVIA